MSKLSFSQSYKLKLSGWFGLSFALFLGFLSPRSLIVFSFLQGLAKSIAIVTHKPFIGHLTQNVHQNSVNEDQFEAFRGSEFTLSDARQSISTFDKKTQKKITRLEKVKMEGNDPATTGKQPSTLLMATKRGQKDDRCLDETPSHHLKTMIETPNY